MLADIFSGFLYGSFEAVIRHKNRMEHKDKKGQPEKYWPPMAIKMGIWRCNRISQYPERLCNRDGNKKPARPFAMIDPKETVFV